MSKASFEPGDEAVEAERGGAALLARRALLAPDPPPQAERESRERVLAQFEVGPLSPRALHPDRDAAVPAPAAWTQRAAHALRRILGR